jgi:hypothetical protein
MEGKEKLGAKITKTKFGNIAILPFLKIRKTDYYVPFLTNTFQIYYFNLIPKLRIETCQIPVMQVLFWF